MTDDTAGFRFWGIEYDEHGAPVGSAERELEAALATSAVEDLFIISHGWNNSPAMARVLYDRFFDEVAGVLGGARATIGVVGITWPSMRWPDEELPDTPFGGAAGLDGGDFDVVENLDEAAIVATLREIYPDPAWQATLSEIEDLLERQPSEESALERFQALLAELAAGPDAPDAVNDDGEGIMVTAPATDVFEEAADLDAEGFQEGAAGFGDVFGRLWSGAKQALRQTTYWTMKKRAGIVGSSGLAQLIERLADASPTLRIHLVGHSFGARLVSYAVWGLPQAVADRSPVKSLTLLQGAFSHFAFAPTLPHDPGRSGSLVDVVKRVDGPVVATFSDHDRALGFFYPRGSILGRDDAAAADSPLFRWGAIGHDGAQSSDATEIPVGPPASSYGFQVGRIHNLDANDVIATGDGRSGAHSDLFHPELAWAVLDAAAVKL